MEARPFEAAIVDTQLGELTSLVDAKRSGDPFTSKTARTRRRWGWSRPTRSIKLVGQPQIASLSAVRTGAGEARSAADSSSTKLDEGLAERDDPAAESADEHRRPRFRAGRA